MGVIAISIQVTMVLTLVGLSDGMLNDQAAARAAWAPIFWSARQAARIIISGGQMIEKIIPAVIDKEPHVTVASGTLDLRNGSVQLPHWRGSGHIQSAQRRIPICAGRTFPSTRMT